MKKRYTEEQIIKAIKQHEAGAKVEGICRMQLTESGEHVSLYMTPISLNPENPAMPISHHSYYATYLAKRVGPYATLGLAEDTWALNEKVTDDRTFMTQTLDIDDEREEMLHAAQVGLLDRGTKYGPIVDGWVIPDVPLKLMDSGKAHNVPIIAGSNADEATLFSQRAPVRREFGYRLIARSVFKQNADAVLEVTLLKPETQAAP